MKRAEPRIGALRRVVRPFVCKGPVLEIGSCLEPSPYLTYMAA